MADSLDLLQKFQLVAPGKVQEHRQVWKVLAEAIRMSRRIRSDTNDEPGTYEFATKALTWLLSADAVYYLDTIKCGPVIEKTLQRIGYRELYKRIETAAKSSPAGRLWLQGEDFQTLTRLKVEADIYFKAGAKVAV